jgi:hypothetical protein
MTGTGHEFLGSEVWVEVHDRDPSVAGGDGGQAGHTTDTTSAISLALPDIAGFEQLFGLIGFQPTESFGLFA